ncbi:MAG: hypothetical protein AB7T10_04695 [bacterium]
METDKKTTSKKYNIVDDLLRTFVGKMGTIGFVNTFKRRRRRRTVCHEPWARKDREETKERF